MKGFDYSETFQKIRITLFKLTTQTSCRFEELNHNALDFTLLKDNNVEFGIDIETIFRN